MQLTAIELGPPEYRDQAKREAVLGEQRGDPHGNRAL
jgi:hypothetical protein